ncbi:MAG: hypothetical protein ACI9W6_000277 [Motiliproteus sp.]|jgi:hypothetical protein
MHYSGQAAECGVKRITHDKGRFVMNDEELRIKMTQNKAKREKINTKIMSAKEKREKERAEVSLQHPDKNTFCRVLLKEDEQRKKRLSSLLPQYIKGTRRDGRCLDGSLDMTLSVNKNKRKYMD